MLLRIRIIFYPNENASEISPLIIPHRVISPSFCHCLFPRQVCRDSLVLEILFTEYWLHNLYGCFVLCVVFFFVVVVVLLKPCVWDELFSTVMGLYLSLFILPWCPCHPHRCPITVSLPAPPASSDQHHPLNPQRMLCFNEWSEVI